MESRACAASESCWRIGGKSDRLDSEMRERGMTLIPFVDYFRMAGEG